MALVVVDASEGLADLDLQVAYEAQRAKCATAILFNKWDIATIDLDKAVERIRGRVQMKPPHLTVSAVTGEASTAYSLSQRHCSTSTQAASPRPNSTVG